MAVAHHLRRFDAALRIDPVAHRALTLQTHVQRPLRVARRLLGDRQVLPARRLGRCQPGTLGRLGLDSRLGFQTCALRLLLRFAGLPLAFALGFLALAFLALALPFVPLLLDARLLGTFESQLGLLPPALFDAWVALRLRRPGLRRLRLDRRLGQWLDHGFGRRLRQADQLGLEHAAGGGRVQFRRPAV